MAAEMVLWKNLQRTLEGLNNREVEFPSSLREELDTLLILVRESERAVVSLENRDHIHDSLMRGRLENLSTLLHEADDLLDQILTIDHRIRLCRGGGEVNGRQNRSRLARSVINAMSRSTQEVIVFLSSSNQLVFPKVMAGRVEKISNDIKKLTRQLANENNDLPLESRFEPIVWVRPAEETVIGRENDMDSIVNMLLKPSKDSKSNVSVICMSGVAGVGKSALAKDIYQDDRVTSCFDLRMWIPATHITDEKDIIREIVESCTNKRYNSNGNSKSEHYHNSRAQCDGNSYRGLLGCRSSSAIPTSLHNNSDSQSEIEIYERRLRKEIRGKLYLLILDDVCLQRWQKLRDLLAGGAKGSRILVTTRLCEVTNLVINETTEVKPYPLKGLSQENSWTLFKTFALGQDEACDRETKKTGLEIVDICKQLPITIKVAARFLHGRNRDRWLQFKEELKSIRDLEEDVMDHVLHLTCSDLPTCLRACFGYCSLFPDDFTFNRHDLISLWIAQGFINPHDCQSPEEVRESQVATSLEEIGEMYFTELLRRCLFEELKTDELGNIKTCKMHHIVKKHASKLTAGFANISMTDSSMIQVPDPTSKHVSVNCRGYSSLKFSSPLVKGPSLRTLIFIKEPDFDIKVDTLMCNRLISSYRRLRVLDLQDVGLKELPDSISEQIHLRYLDLSKNDSLVTLPKTFNKLYNLQTLKLNSCPKLEWLASDFGLLVNLKRFEVDGCDSLTCMPLGLEKLTRLETLSRLVVSKGSSKQTALDGLRALHQLTMLRGRLEIELTNILEFNQAELEGDLMKNISKLRDVKIRWAQRTSDVEVLTEEDISAQQEAILEHLQPNSDLKIFSIEGYKGGYFPRWASIENISSSLPNLVVINIEGCGKCEFLPPFGELEFLEKLTLRYMTNVRYIEERPRGNGGVIQDGSLFRSLRELTLHNFYKLEWWWKEHASLHDAEIRSFPCLSNLRIRNCPKLRSLRSFPKVKDLRLRNVNQLLLGDCKKRACRSRDKVLTQNLQIKSCPTLDEFKVISSGLGGLPSLKSLMIDSCDALNSLAEDIGKIPSLAKLEISNCKELDLSHESQIWCRIVNHLPQRIFSMSPWKKLRSLRELTLREIPKMETLPDGLQHVQTLKILRISVCKSLGSLPEWIGSLTSLQHLRIESCRALKRLPQGLKNVKSLMKVEITECPDLMERCREDTGEDWPYIKHARVLLHKSWRYGYVS